MANEPLFQICCPTCEAVFAVTDPELIGQIIACPKCGGMILVAASEKLEGVSERSDSINASTPPSEGREIEWESADFFEKTADVAPPAEETEPANERVVFPNRENGETSKKDGGDANAEGVESDGESILKEKAPETSAEKVERERNFRIRLAFYGVGAALVIVGIVVAISSVFFKDGGKVVDVDATVSKTAVAVEEPEKSRNDAVSEDDEEIFESLKPTFADVDGEIIDQTDFGGVESESVFETASEDASPSENAEEAAIASDATVPVVENDATLETEKAEDGDVVEIQKNGEEASSAETPELVDEFATSDFDGEFNETEFEKANKSADENPESVELPVEEDLGAVASTTDLTLPDALSTVRLAAKAIDVDARLALRIKSIEFPSSPVAAVRLLSEFSGVPIAFDWDSFALLRPSISAALELKAEDVDVGEALEKVAELANWRVEKRESQMVLLPKDFDPTVFVEERFDLSDLLSTGAADADDLTKNAIDDGENSDESVDSDEFDGAVEVAEETVDGAETPFLLPKRLDTKTLEIFIKTFVEPQSWTENGGKGATTWVGTSLVAFQSAQNRKKIAILLEQLRALRRLDAKSSIPTDELIPETIAWDAASAKTSFNLLEPTPLQNALEILEKSPKFPFKILWDDAALRESGVGRDSTTFVRVDDGTFDVALVEALDPLGLTYLALDKNLLLITTKERAESYKTIETHFWTEPNSSQQSSEEYEKTISELKAAVAPKSWGSSNSVDEAGANAIWIDESSAVAIVRQSQPNQRAVRRWFEARVARERETRENGAKKKRSKETKSEKTELATSQQENALKNDAEK